jgi:magnesium chelatase accessory protein
MSLYRRLMQNPRHVGATLTMMAHWDLRPLQRDLPRLQAPLVLVAAGNDRTLPPSEAKRARALLPAAELVDLPSLGHLAHEERPDRVAELVLDRARAWGALPIGRAAR